MGLSPMLSPCGAAAADTPGGDQPDQEGTKHSFTSGVILAFQKAFLAPVVY